MKTILTRFSGFAWCFLVFLCFLRQKAIEGVLAVRTTGVMVNGSDLREGSTGFVVGGSVSD
ncbi:TPA: hypothetical protein ACTDME_004760 [Salmonella enterica subsp. enterica]